MRARAVNLTGTFSILLRCLPVFEDQARYPRKMRRVAGHKYELMLKGCRRDHEICIPTRASGILRFGPQIESPIPNRIRDWQDSGILAEHVKSCDLCAGRLLLVAAKYFVPRKRRETERTNQT